MSSGETLNFLETALRWDAGQSPGGSLMIFNDVFGGLLAGEIIVRRIVEGERDLGQPVKGNRADGGHARHAVEGAFEREGDELLDGLAGQAGGRFTNITEAAGVARDGQNGDGPLWQHQVKLAWEGLIEMKR